MISMTAKKIMYGVILAALLVPTIGNAFAQYYPTGTNIRDVYDAVQDGERKTDIATQDGAFGSGTPYFAADGVIGSSIIAAGVFGGVATMLFVKGRNGKYAAQGRG